MRLYFLKQTIFAGVFCDVEAPSTGHHSECTPSLIFQLSLNCGPAHGCIMTTVAPQHSLPFTELSE